MMNIKLSDEQCNKLAQKILGGKFGMYGQGNFDIGITEFTEILRIAFNENNAEEKIETYYKTLSSRIF